MSLRDSHAKLVRYARARVRNHSRSSGVGSMCVHSVPESVNTRKTILIRVTNSSSLRYLMDNQFLEII